ncbi:hypothetical protein [Sandarakinorhabdus cyanobacteriorum]|uniref:hypothetical protein n=1 Tax=Sandarakinorhabdus cyanobacteriorum TaxID=1981098 RepID=UPI0010558A34|nr:hypothetical protein [Sandarakinorhabdus cyanobacteriorum]
MRILLLAAALAGLAAQPLRAQASDTVASPAAPPPLGLFIDGKGPNGMSDLPMGVKRIPDSNIVVSGHQKGGALGLLFGVVGMAIQSSANTDAGGKRTNDIQDALRFDVTGRARELTTSILAEKPFEGAYTLLTEESPTAVSMVPYIVLTFVNETDVRPYIVLKTKLEPEAGSKKPRTIKYFCCEGPAMPLTGAGSLTENNGEKLKALLNTELDTALRLMLTDRRQPFARDDEARLDIKGSLPFVGKPLKWRGWDLGNFKDYRLLEFRGGIMVFGGVHAVEPGALEITPYVKKK